MKSVSAVTCGQNLSKRQRYFKFYFFRGGGR
jgi:hypothetical protein